MMIPSIQVSFECELCPRSFTKDTYLKLHRESHIGDQISPVQCNQCDQQFLTLAKYDEHVYHQHLDFSEELENSSLLNTSVIDQQNDLYVTESESGTVGVSLSNTSVSNSDITESAKESLTPPRPSNIIQELNDPPNPTPLYQQTSVNLQVDLTDYFLIVHRKDGNAPNEGDFTQYFGITAESFFNCVIPDQLKMETADISKGLAIDLKILCDLNKYSSTVLMTFLYELLPTTARPLDTSCLLKSHSDKLLLDLQKLQFRAKKFKAKYRTLPKYLHALLLEKYHPFKNQ